jgi:hypothetical protein
MYDDRPDYKTLQERIQELINLHLDNTEALYDAAIAISNQRGKSNYQRADNLKTYISEMVDAETETDYTNPTQSMINDIITRALAYVDWLEIVKDHQPDTPQVDAEEEEEDAEPFADNPRLQTAYAEFIAAVEDDEDAGHTISSMRAVRDANDRLQDIAQEAETE